MDARRFSSLLALLAISIGAIGFCGWVFGIDSLKRLHPALVTMKANTALCLILTGTALLLLLQRHPSRRARFLAQAFGGIVLSVGGLTLAQILGGWDFGIDQAIFHESAESAGRSFPGRMGPTSAAVFILFGTALLLFYAPPWLEVTPTQLCALAAMGLTFVVFLGYFYNVEVSTALAPYLSIALHTVVAFLALSAAFMLAQPDRGFVVLFLADNASGVVARRALPFAILGPAVLGWLFALLRENNFYGRGMAVALLAASVTLMFTTLIWWQSRALARMEKHRQLAEEALHLNRLEASEKSEEDAAKLRQARDAADAANRAKDEFLAALSHELRTPLTPVLMLATAMEGAPDLPVAVRSAFTTIRRNVELETRIIDDLLDLTRITHKKLSFRLEAVAVHALVSHAVSIVEAERLEKNIVLVLELEAPRSRVQGDSARLQQVVWNVLKNAIKFSPPRSCVRIRSRNEGAQWRLSVTDSGLGITAEEMPRIFTAFSQGSEAASRFGGLGLGLSISALLVQQHRGRLWAESAGRDHGATFHLELPLLQCDPKREPAQPAESSALDAQRKLRVLLVEDHEDTREVLSHVLGRWGHEVQAVGSVAAARETLASAGAYDLLLSDLALPDGSGFDVIAAWRAATNAPAVAMSGYGMEGDLDDSRTAGFSEHLIKPVAIDALREMLARHSAAQGEHPTQLV